MLTGWSGGTLGTAYAFAELKYATIRLNANGSYVVDASAADSLAAGQTVSHTFTYDVLAGQCRWHIQPHRVFQSHDYRHQQFAPVVSGAVTGTATEDGANSTLNALARASDVDDGATLTVTGLPAALPAGVSYNEHNHNHKLDPGNAAYDHLAKDATTTVTVNYAVSDGVTLAGCHGCYR